MFYAWSSFFIMFRQVTSPHGHFPLKTSSLMLRLITLPRAMEGVWLCLCSDPVQTCRTLWAGPRLSCCRTLWGKVHNLLWGANVHPASLGHGTVIVILWVIVVALGWGQEEDMKESESKKKKSDSTKDHNNGLLARSVFLKAYKIFPCVFC